ncbi:hypothetical protein ACA910_019968 [Epithemia clementina (nom. ined.)]
MEILRSNLPHVYQRVVKAMPPPRAYQNFCFGYNLIEQSPLATVVHPVRYPLQQEKDANGKLLEENMENSSNNNANDDEETLHRRALSPCKVGHLAQHKFAKILYEEARKAGSISKGGRSIGALEFGIRVDRVTNDEIDPSGRRLLVHTTCGKSWSSDVCVAVDGANSSLRQAQRLGNFKEQFLINVHVKLTPDQENSIPNEFMLFTVLNEHVVAMVVSHGDGEYVLQIPFFPPYQDPEVDFDMPKVVKMLTAVFGFSTISSEQVLSVRPWTMTSWVASRYHNRKGLVWAGDASHAFPPAGGFGMNTGLQDVHNLAWKLYSLFKQHSRQGSSDNFDHHSENKGFVQKRNDWLDSYERERRPVAMENAALSVRNYDRVLAVMNQCYLNHKHPELAKDTLDGMSSLVPLSSRQDVFRSLIKAALQPLAWLKVSSSSSVSASSPNLYRDHVQSNLRRLLTSGGGLPLLFPKFEVGFGYQDNAKSSLEETLCHEEGDAQKKPLPSDTFAGVSLTKIQVGRRLPHATITPYASNNISTASATTTPCEGLGWSTVDFPARLTGSPANGEDGSARYFFNEPSWIILVLDPATIEEMLGFWEEMRAAIQNASRISTDVVYLVKNLDLPNNMVITHNDDGRAPLHPQHHVYIYKPEGEDDRFNHGVALVRPDGHVAAFLESKESLQEKLLSALLC